MIFLQDRRNDEADVAHELALQKTLAELKLLAKEKFDQVPFLISSKEFARLFGQG
jgi:hypothetical protein